MLRKIVNLGVLVACLALSGCAYYDGYHFSGHYHFGTRGPGYYGPGYYRQPSFSFGFSWHSPVYRWRYWHHRYPENALWYPDESLICLETDDRYPTDITRLP